MSIGMEGIVQKPKKERRTKLGIVSIKIVEDDDDGREVFEVHILTIFFSFSFLFSPSLAYTYMPFSLSLFLFLSHIYSFTLFLSLF
jgi:hypothetical protein